MLAVLGQRGANPTAALDYAEYGGPLCFRLDHRDTCPIPRLLDHRLGEHPISELSRLISLLG